jgi:hypothetical protein
LILAARSRGTASLRRPNLAEYEGKPEGDDEFDSVLIQFARKIAMGSPAKDIEQPGHAAPRTLIK